MMTRANLFHLISWHGGTMRAMRALDARIARARTEASRVLLRMVRTQVESEADRW